MIFILYFEYLECIVVLLNNYVRLCVIYCLLVFKFNGFKIIVFFEEWLCYFDKFVIIFEELIIIGDFNFYVDDLNNIDV